MISELPEEIASRTEQPPFDEVVTRVREDRQRAWRRTAAAGGVLALAALVVVPQIGGDSAQRQPSDPGPTGPSPTTSLALGVPELLSRPGAQVVAINGSDDGGVAALWQACSSDGTGCRYAVLTDQGTSLGSVVVDSSVLSPVSGGWLIHTAGGWRKLASDGWVSGVTTAGEDGLRPGDQTVETAGGLGLLRGNRLLLMPSASGSPTDAYATPQGRLLEVTATGDGSERLRASTDGRHWDTLRSWGSGSGVTRVGLAGRGRTIAAVMQSVDADGHAVIRQVDVSHDAGRTWTSARGIDSAGEVRDLSAVAVSPHRTVFLTTASDGLIRISPDGHAARTPVGVHDRDVFTTTYEVCVLTTPRGDRPDVVACSDDDGTSWTRRSVPGASLTGR